MEKIKLHDNDWRRAAALLTSSTDGVLELDRNWCITFVSDLPAQLLGPGAVGNDVWEIAPQFVGTRFEAELRHAMTTGTSVEITDRSPMNGRWTWVRAVPHAGGLTVCYRDVDWQKRIEIELRRSKELLQTIFDTVPIGLMITNRRGEIINHNREADRVWAGVRNVGIDGYDLYKAWHYATGEPLHPSEWGANKALVGETELHEELLIQAFDNTWRVVDHSALPLKASPEDDTINGSLVVFQDITEAKRIQEAKEKALSDLEKANASRSRLIATLAHDIQQPLFGVRLQLGQLDINGSPEDVRSCLDRCVDVLRSAENLIDQLAETAALQTGSIPVTMTETDIIAVIDEISAEAAAIAREKHLEFRARRPCVPALPVMTDPELLKRALRNLLSNAIRYTREGGILIGVRIRKGKPCIEVWDTGIGINEEEIQSIFGEFYRGADHRKTGDRGLGLGLAAVASIASLLNLTVQARSRTGRGSVFSLCF